MAVLAAIPLSRAWAQSAGDAAAGEALARGVCAQCHKVANDASPPQRSGAPDFAVIANMSSTTETALHVFLTSPHPRMPNLILTPPQQDDIIAYILKLRKPS
jgi:mono/diheme cytochrome c family protein